MELISFTAGDGYVWKYRRYEPAGASRGSVIGLHGIQSHGGWYEGSCTQIAAAGYTVSFLDRRGCGMNDRDRGDAPSFRRLLDDIAEFMVGVPRPRFLLGISWGGKLAVALQRRRPEITDGSVLIAPGLCPRVRLGFVDRLRVLVCRLVAPGRQITIPLNDAELFTANPARQAFIRADPRALRTATARLLFESRRMDVYLRFAARHVSAAALVLLAGEDRIIDNEATRRLVGSFPGNDRTVIEFAKAHHTMEFEPGGPPYLPELLKWLDDRSTPVDVR